MRVRAPKPNRTFLEMDELAALLDAAAAQEQPLRQAKTPAELGHTTALVAHLLAQGRRPQQIAKQLGLAKSTVSHHVAKLNANIGRGYIGRRVVCEILGPPACARASCVTCASATCACTTPTARASASPTQRPRPASARSR